MHGGVGNRTRVRKRSTPSVYVCISRFVVAARRAHERALHAASDPFSRPAPGSLEARPASSITPYYESTGRLFAKTALYRLLSRESKRVIVRTCVSRIFLTPLPSPATRDQGFSTPVETITPPYSVVS